MPMKKDVDQVVEEAAYRALDRSQHTLECNKANAEHIGPRSVCVCARQSPKQTEYRHQLRLSFGVLFLSARIVTALPWNELDVQSAGQPSAPVCIKFCAPDAARIVPQPVPPDVWYWHKCPGGGVWCPRDLDLNKEQLKGNV